MSFRTDILVDRRKKNEENNFHIYDFDNANGNTSLTFANENFEIHTLSEGLCMSEVEVLEDGSVFIPDTRESLNLSLRGIGKCTGDGVKLKTKAGSGDTTLELVYKGEELLVYDVLNATVPSGWEYVQRSKTGTRGYMSEKYIESVGPASIE